MSTSVGGRSGGLCGFFWTPGWVLTANSEYATGRALQQPESRSGRAECLWNEMRAGLRGDPLLNVEERRRRRPGILPGSAILAGTPGDTYQVSVLLRMRRP